MKRNVIIGLIILMAASSAYWVYRIQSNNQIITSYDANYRTGTKIDQLNKSWQENTGTSKNPFVTYKDMQNATNDNEFSHICLIIIDCAFLVAIFFAARKIKN